jgi:hypothetical protein
MAMVPAENGLYNYVLILIRSVLHEYYTPVYSTQEMLRLCYRWTVLPEFCSIVGEKCFGRLMDVFAGITVTFRSKSALEKMRRSREFLNGLSDEKQAFAPGPLSANTEHQLLGALLEGHHSETSLVTPNGKVPHRCRPWQPAALPESRRKT